jgi:hypothetical protein
MGHIRLSKQARDLAVVSRASLPRPTSRQETLESRVIARLIEELGEGEAAATTIQFASRLVHPSAALRRAKPRSRSRRGGAQGATPRRHPPYLTGRLEA